jgi:hypothetical protein
MELSKALCDRLQHAGAVIVGSVDSTGVPSCAHACALRVTPESSTVTVYLPVATCQTILADVATNGRLAVTTANPLDNATVQLKGKTQRVRMAPESERAFVDSRVAVYAHSLEVIGFPTTHTKGIVSWPAFAVDLLVDGIFEQTPGPRAGLVFTEA